MQLQQQRISIYSHFFLLMKPNKPNLLITFALKEGKRFVANYIGSND